MAENLRLVVCTGDVQIERGVSFHGIIMIDGKMNITVRQALPQLSVLALLA